METHSNKHNLSFSWKLFMKTENFWQEILAHLMVTTWWRSAPHSEYGLSRIFFIDVLKWRHLQPVSHRLWILKMLVHHPWGKGGGNKAPGEEYVELLKKTTHVRILLKAMQALLCRLPTYIKYSQLLLNFTKKHQRIRTGRNLHQM
jgi:hypothetical protein